MIGSGSQLHLESAPPPSPAITIQEDLTPSHYSTYRRVPLLTSRRVLCMTDTPVISKLPMIKIFSNYRETLVVRKRVFRVLALGDERLRMRLQVHTRPT